MSTHNYPHANMCITSVCGKTHALHVAHCSYSVDKFEPKQRFRVKIGLQVGSSG